MALSEVGILSDDELQKIYVWVDSIPLSRPKRNIARDFSDGVLTAEIAHHYFPKYVELHNYSSANSIRQKLYNWSTLNREPAAQCPLGQSACASALNLSASTTTLGPSLTDACRKGF